MRHSGFYLLLAPNHFHRHSGRQEGPNDPHKGDFGYPSPRNLSLSTSFTLNSISKHKEMLAFLMLDEKDRRIGDKGAAFARNTKGKSWG